MSAHLMMLCQSDITQPMLDGNKVPDIFDEWKYPEKKSALSFFAILGHTSMRMI